MTCPGCSRDRGPRAAFPVDGGWRGCCDRNRTHWALDREVPLGVPRLAARPPMCTRDLDVEAAVQSAGFTRAATASYDPFWVRADFGARVFNTAEARALIEKVA